MLPLPLSHLLQPTLTEIARLPARSNLCAHPDHQSLDAEDSPWRLSLDGAWRFQLVDRPDAAPDDWMISDARSEPWRAIQVPGVWTRQDTGDFPHYANWQMPFDCPQPPEVPTENPTGLYRTEFERPGDWSGRQTILHLGGFESLVMVWCNGAFMGMGKDSRLPSEFDLSGAVRPGANELAIMVVRWCDATWIEDQDHWNHGGLHRSVFVESRGVHHVKDLVVDTDFDPSGDIGTAIVRVETNGASAGYAARVSLADDQGDVIATAPSAAIEQFDTAQSVGRQWAQSYSFAAYASTISIRVPNAKPWSAERPTRYRLTTELIDPDGQVTEVHETWIGFSRIEITGRRLKVNGRPIVLIGVNRHDHHPENGKTCSVEEFRAELITMKRHNINAIRTAHYPNDPALLDLADELGFYVIDEANVECHARWSEVANHPGYQAAIVERTVRMIARDRNHPCIIGWSLGNEAGHGPAHDAAAAAARHLDPTRFVHYEGAVSLRLSFPFGQSPETTQQTPSAKELAATDVVCPMYPPIDHVVDWARWAETTEADDRPMILCEFSHAMGNSNGSISDYVDAFFDEPALAGGFVWDWRDQGLAETDAEGRFFWAYGGHYGDAPNDANFNINGLVGPDGVPHPALREYMWAARPVTADLIEGARVRVTNRRAFESTSDLRLDWSVLAQGVPVETGSLSPVIAPGGSIEIDLPLSPLPSDTECHLTLEWRITESQTWANPDHVVAWDQFCLNEDAGGAGHSSGQGQNLTIEQDETKGLRPLSASGTALLASAITPCVWRAPTDNDGGKPGARPLFPNRTSEWIGYGLDQLQPEPAKWEETSSPDGGVSLVQEQNWRGADGEILQHRTRVTASAEGLIFDETIIIPPAWKDLPRVGIRFEISSALDQLEWFGLGPDESYPDRKRAQTVGVWRSTVADQYHPYVRPQEYGAHEDTHWFKLFNAAGEGLQITLPRALSVTARMHHDHDLNEAETLAELQSGASTEVHIDAAVRGLGTAACGPDTLPQYRVGPGTYQFRWGLSAL